jgi:ubiquitin carboxyl-terminal hydrolase L3
MRCNSHVDGNLYELDGRKRFPINHGPSTPDTLLADACAVVQQFMDRDPGEMRFTIVAFGGPSVEEA